MAHAVCGTRWVLVATVTYSFLMSESDPDATDFTAATTLLQTQLDKAASAWPE